jgi:hypothetical protein
MASGQEGRADGITKRYGSGTSFHSRLCHTEPFKNCSNGLPKSSAQSRFGPFGQGLQTSVGTLAERFSQSAIA